MHTPRALFIGGTGIMSAECARLTMERGFDLTIVNRGASMSRPIPAGATVLQADARDRASLAAALGNERFDVVVDWVAFTPEHVADDIEFFAGRVSQYVFISSASAYQTPPARLPVRESTPLRNPFWEYSRNKAAAEAVLENAYRTTGFPVTIVRPSHTYDQTMVPFDGGWTIVDRMRRGLGVVVPGDGTSLWTITHHTDFARGFVGLLGRSDVLGEAFHITSDEALPWNAIYRSIASAAGVDAPILVHVPSDAVAAVDPEWGAALLGDKSHSMIFDNSKIRSIVPNFAATMPFDRGAAEIISWHDADPVRRTIDKTIDARMDTLIAAFSPRAL